MSEKKLVVFIVFVGITFATSVGVWIFMAIPKDKLAEQWAHARVMTFKHEINQCNEDGGSAYVTDNDRVFCERVGL